MPYISDDFLDEIKPILSKLSIYEQMTEKERAELIEHLGLVKKIFAEAQEAGYAKGVDIERQEKALLHKFFPINQGIGYQYNTYNSIIDNLDSIERTKTDVFLLDKNGRKYLIKIESILLHYLWSYATNVELAFSLLGELINFDLLRKNSKDETKQKKKEETLTVGDRLGLLNEAFGDDAKKLSSHFDVSLRNDIQHFNISFHRDEGGIYVLHKSKKLDLVELFKRNKSANIGLTAILIFFMIILASEKRLREAAYLEMIINSCNLF